LYIPKNTEIHLQLDIEQYPDRNNCITLGEELDKYGRHVAKIKWKISEYDVKNAKIIAEKFLKKWSLFEGIRLNIFNENQSVMKPFDAYHPVGTCCMGKNKESVVDENLKVWGVENLWVVSTGVLPSAGTANPTFTMLCLAERLTEQIIIKGCRVE
jgi:choline dehydrogenase-like flavoprotein